MIARAHQATVSVEPFVLGARLGEAERRLHRALLDALIASGAIPPADALAKAAKLTVDAVPVALQQLAAGDYLAFDGDRRLACVYPFSTAPTPHVIVIAGARRYAMCAIDALGIAAMLGQTVQVEATCAACEAPIDLSIRPAALDTVEPATAVVVARRIEDEPAVLFTCPFTVFACSQIHASHLSDRVPAARVLPLTEAHALGETLFAGHLAPSLPAKRCRR